MEKAMQDILKNIDFSNDYVQRKTFIDSNIEDFIKYYNPCIRPRAILVEGLDIPKIQKQLRKNRDILEKKKLVNQSRKVIY